MKKRGRTVKRRVWERHLGLFAAAAVLHSLPHLGAQEEQPPETPAVSDQPVLESDFVIPVMRGSMVNPPDLLLAPQPTLRALPDEPEPADSQEPAQESKAEEQEGNVPPTKPKSGRPVFAMTPPKMVEPPPAQGPEADAGMPLALLPPLDLEMPLAALNLDADLDPYGQGPELPPNPAQMEAQEMTALPLAPEPNTFIQPQIAPPLALPPDIYGIPNPLLSPVPGLEQELAPYTVARLGRRYSLQLRSALAGLYDDSAVNSATDQQSEFTVSYAPELAFTAGTDQSRAALRLAYAPVFNWYTQKTEKDSIDHHVGLDGRYQSGKLLLGTHLSASKTRSGGTLDTGPLSDSQTYIAALTSLYQITGKTSIDLVLDDTCQNYSTFNGSNEARLQGFVNYRPYGADARRGVILPPGADLAPFKFGLGAMVGVMEVSNEPPQRYLQPLGRMIYTYRKLSLTALGGYEFRDLGANRGSSSDPIFQLGAAYQLFPRTLLLIDAQRRVYASQGSGDQNYIMTSFNGMIRQSFPGYGRNFFASLAGGLQNSSYSPGRGPIPAPAGEEDYFFVRVALDWAVRERILLGGFYEYSENSTNRPGMIGFKRNRVGLRCTIVFF